MRMSIAVVYLGIVANSRRFFGRIFGSNVLNCLRLDIFFNARCNWETGWSLCDISHES